MSYCGFSQIINILYNQVGTVDRLNQTMFLTDFIFKSYDKNKALIKDISGINRWFTGEYSVDGDIREYYANNREKLYYDIENSYCKNAADFYSAADEIYKIVLCDTSISEGKKEELYKNYKKDKHNLSVFIAEVLIFSMCREKSKLKIKSPIADEIIVGCKANKPCKFFVGRDKEIEKLHSLIQDNNCVFIEGIGGIGKSEFVKKYIQLYKNEYTNIIYLRYNGSLKNMIADIQFVTDMEKDDSEYRFHRHYNFLKSLRDDTLIVIDNFDTTIENEPFFDDFINNEYKIIFTTRSNFDEYEYLQLDVIKDDEQILSIINSFYTVNAENRSVLLSVIETVNRHTLSVEIAARLLKSSNITPSELLSKLIENSIKLDIEEKIQIKKDNRTSKKTYYNHLHTLFRLFELTEKQKYIMINFCFVSVKGVEKALFSDWIKEPTANNINDLIELGLIKCEDKWIYINPVIRDVVMAELEPKVTDCKDLINSIKSKCIAYGSDKYYYLIMLEFVENIIDFIKIDDFEVFMSLLEQSFCYAEKYKELWIMRKIIRVMNSHIKNKTSLNIRYKALFYMFKAQYAVLRYANAYDGAAFIEKAIEIIGKSPKKEFKHLLSNLYSNLGFYMQVQNKYNNMEILNYYEKAYQLLKETDELYSYDGYVLAKKIAECYAVSGNIKKAIEVLEQFAEYFKPYYIPQNYVEYIECCQKEKFNSLLEYAELLEVIGILKSKINQNTDIEKRTALKIYNTVFENQPDKFVEHIEIIKLLK